MSAPTSTPRMCPLLGLAQDSGSAHLYASDQHRCYATGERQAVSASHQEQFCLTRSYAYCPIFLAAQTQANKARKAATAQSALAVSLVPENEPSDALPHDSGARLSNLSRATLIG